MMMTSVTSTPTAKMLISVRKGRCKILLMIICQIILGLYSCAALAGPLVASRACSLLDCGLPLRRVLADAN